MDKKQELIIEVPYGVYYEVFRNKMSITDELYLDSSFKTIFNEPNATYELNFGKLRNKKKRYQHVEIDAQSLERIVEDSDKIIINATGVTKNISFRQETLIKEVLDKKRLAGSSPLRSTPFKYIQQWNGKLNTNTVQFDNFTGKVSFVSRENEEVKENKQSKLETLIINSPSIYCSIFKTRNLKNICINLDYDFLQDSTYERPDQFLYFNNLKDVKKIEIKGIKTLDYRYGSGPLTLNNIPEDCLIYVDPTTKVFTNITHLMGLQLFNLFKETNYQGRSSYVEFTFKDMLNINQPQYLTYSEYCRRFVNFINTYIKEEHQQAKQKLLSELKDLPVNLSSIPNAQKYQDIVVPPNTIDWKDINSHKIIDLEENLADAIKNTNKPMLVFKTSDFSSENYQSTSFSPVSVFALNNISTPYGVKLINDVQAKLFLKNFEWDPNSSTIKTLTPDSIEIESSEEPINISLDKQLMAPNLKSLVLNTRYNVSANIDSQPQLEKIKITSGYGSPSSLSFSNLPNLKEIDLTGLSNSEIKATSCKFMNLPDDCIIKLNKFTFFEFTDSDERYLESNAKRSLYCSHYYSNYTRHIYMHDVEKNSIEQGDNIIMTYAQFRKNLTLFGLNYIDNKVQESQSRDDFKYNLIDFKKELSQSKSTKIKGN